jgi:hypothetical protein
LDISNDTEPSQVPGLEKTLEEGSFVVTATVDIEARGLASGEFGEAECVLADKTKVTEKERSSSGLWAGATTETSPTPLAFGDITLTLALTDEPSTLNVKCKKVARSAGVTLEAVRGSLMGAQTSFND